LLVGIVRLVRVSAKLRAALGTAQAFHSVDGAAWSTLNRHSVAALDAGCVPCFFRQSSAQSTAFGRTVHRVFTEFFAVGSNRSRLVPEQLAANTAGEIGAFDARVLAPENSFVRSFARSTTEFLSRSLRLDFEVLSAAFANLLDRHLGFSYLVGTSGRSTVCWACK
jgi:hypothetical protein